MKTIRCIKGEGKALLAGTLYRVSSHKQDDMYTVEIDSIGRTGGGWLKSRFVDELVELTPKKFFSYRDAGDGFHHEAQFADVENRPVVSARDSQIGGSHYKGLGIQPFEYAIANNMGPCEFTALGYMTRWKVKHLTPAKRIEDLEKAVHAIQFLIEHEKGKQPC